MRTFDLLTAPLTGINLIEASAGTGKTHSITRLLLRLLLEKEIPIENVLVVTYTEAATQELSARIRSVLSLARECANGTIEEGCEDIGGIIGRVGMHQAKLLLDRALRSLDEAPIFTIHGFCARILQEFAFETGSLFDADLVKESHLLVAEIVEDFWRNHLYSAHPLFCEYALSNDLDPQNLSEFALRMQCTPNLRILPSDIDATMPDCGGYENAWYNLQAAWLASRKEVEAIFLGGLLKRTANYEQSVARSVREIDHLLANEHPVLHLGERFVRFTAGAICKQTRKGCVTPRHQFFDKCEDLAAKRDALVQGFSRYSIWMRTNLLHLVHSSMQKRKLQLRIRHFDDLILGVQKALAGPNGPGFAQKLRSQYKAALIDEFQDTDAAQYEIFRAIFHGPQTALFYIGDPKQSIYSFRGADVHAYIRAASNASFGATLSTNYRSEAGLVKAVNALFASHQRPFVLAKIGFEEALPSAKGESAPLQIDAQREAAFRFWLMPSESSPWSAKNAEPMILSAISTEITTLLDLSRRGRATIGNRPLAATDFAILVNQNRQAGLVKDELSRAGIPAVIDSPANLFDSPEAADLFLILSAVSEPWDARRLKSALITDILGMTALELEQASRDPQIWESVLTRFRAYHECWKQSGFMAMFRSLLQGEHIRSRLLCRSSGERKITNLLHLGEVLQEASIQEKLGPSLLLRWLSSQCDPRTPRMDEHQLRLESDDNAVRIVTIHKSKGLDFPIVFVPFMWSMSGLRDGPFVFHENEGDPVLSLELGSPDETPNRQKAEKERLSEQIRLLYVSLTRAANRCYLVWGQFEKAGRNALTYLLHSPTPPDSDPWLSCGPRYETLSARDFENDIKRISVAANGNILALPIPGAAEQARLKPAVNQQMQELRIRELGHSIRRDWKVSSFSAMTFAADHHPDDPEKETDVVPETPASPSNNILDNTGGARFGVMVHEILQGVDFRQAKSAEFKTLIESKILQHGFDAKLTPAVSAMLQGVLTNELGPSGPVLSRIEPHHRMAEVEFYMPVRACSPLDLSKALMPGAAEESTEWPEKIGKLTFAPFRGFVHGFIDLVFEWNKRFYLLDWKTNQLGHSANDYGPEALANAMQSSHYLLQSSIYTVALDRFLAQRVPGYNYDRDFGGSIYLFLRGVASSGGGVFHHKLSPAQIQTLQGIFSPI